MRGPGPAHAPADLAPPSGFPQTIGLRRIPLIGASLLGLVIATWLGLRFWVGDALPYLLSHTEETFGRFWPARGTLVVHVIGGSMALFLGPFQFWSGLRRRAMGVHRWTGRGYLAGVALGASSGFLLAPQTALGWSFGVSLAALNVAWVLTTAMAVLAIGTGRVSVHKEWMIRSYVLTFSFVLFRTLFYNSTVREMGTIQEVAATAGWLSWVAPLILTELILQLRRMRGERPARA